MEQKNSKKFWWQYARKHWKFLTVIVLIFVAAFIVFNVSRTFDSYSRSVRFGFEDIGELATQVAYYTQVNVINNVREVFGIEVPFTQSKYIFSYDGVIKAGIKNCQDIQVDIYESVITFTIPEVEVLSNVIDESSLEMYEEAKNIFTPFSPGEFSLAIEKLKANGEKDAIENGLLEGAKLNAQTMLKGFVSTFEVYKDYSVEFNWI